VGYQQRLKVGSNLGITCLTICMFSALKNIQQKATK
jgi:hypothetical protein